MYIVKTKMNTKGHAVREYIYREDLIVKEAETLLDTIATKRHVSYWKDNKNNIYHLRSERPERKGGTAT